MAKRLRLVTGLAVAAAALSSGTALADIDAGELYKLRCSACHGVNGEGTDSTLGFGPALKGNPLVMNAPAPAIIQIIRRGRSGERRIYDKSYPNMPSFGPEVVPDVEALVAYLKDGLQK